MELIDRGFANNSKPLIISSDLLVDDQVTTGSISGGTHDRNASMVLAFLGSFDILVSYYVCYDDDKDSTMVYIL
ncbi:Protein of unknown function [Cotesia congregata]|uniref:Uncharacterized protein n=1 Tax=Cotesia congregata TaxID=51543 RepID=A0A8J2HP57_COTCN|nr:Protein of unknown function [Cotesia congregata]